MEPREMFDQITATYGRPTPAALLQNDMFFWSMYSPQDAPKVLIRRIEDCQEVQILGEDPYTAQQLLNNTVRVASMHLIIYHTHWGPCDCSCCKRSALAEIDHCGCIKKNSNVPAHAFATEIVRETQTTVNELSVIDIYFLLIMNSG
jgi:hypothetical protein